MTLADGLIDEYDEVNADAKKLLGAYRSLVESTTMRNRRLFKPNAKSLLSPQSKADLLVKSPSPSSSSLLLFSKFWIWPIIALMIVLIVIGLCLLRCVIDQRRKARNYTFTSVDTRSTEDENLRALQTNGYENPTYNFFEKKNPHC